MKKRLLLLALPLALAACKKEPRSITYPLHPHAGYPTYGTATFTESGGKGSNTDVTVQLYNLTPGTEYMAHIHKGDTSTYGSAPINLNFGSFTPTGSTYSLSKKWDLMYDDALKYNGCVAVHNSVVGVALGNIGSNAQ